MSEIAERSDTAPAVVSSPISVSCDIRVLHVFRYFRPDFTGEGLFVEKLAPFFIEQGVQSQILATRTFAPGPASRLAGIDRVIYCRDTQAARLRAFWLALRWADVVHFHCMVDRGFVLHGIARLSGRRVVQSATLDDGLGMLVASYRPIYRGLVRRLCRLISAAVAISPCLRDDSCDVLPADRIYLIPQGATPIPPCPSRRAGLRASWCVTDAQTVLLYVGSMTRRKDPLFLVQNHVFTPADQVRLLLIGPDLVDADGMAVTTAIAASPVAAAITRHYYVEDPRPAYAAADIFVFASTKEGFGNVLIEAMAAGLPVVARRLPGVTDSFIDHGRTGFLFDTAAEYTALVQALVDDPGLRRRVGDAARAEVAGGHSLQAVAQRYVMLYRNLYKGAAK